MKKLIGLLFTASAAVLSFSTAAAASTVFDNNPSNTNSSGNNPMAQGYYVAQNFALASAASLNGFTYNAYTTSATLPVTAVNLNIYANNGGAVGAQLFGGTFSVLSSIATGTNGYYTYKDFSVALPNWSLAAGTYFLGLNVAPSQWDMHWTIVNPGSEGLAGGNYISSSGTTGTFNNYAFEHVFTLSAANTQAAVPEPATWAMMLVGFGILGSALRRSRRQPKVTYSFS